MLKYIWGLVNNLFNPAVSLFTKIDNISRVSRKAKVYDRVQVSNSTIGDYTYVGRHSRIIHAEIGKFCSISSDVRVGMSSHTLNLISTSPIFTENKNATGHSWTKTSEVNPYKKVKIGNDVWIGMRAMVLGGVTVGNGAVIGAGAIVTKDVPPYAIVVGVPAKVTRYRFTDDIIQKLEDCQWWKLPDDCLKDNIALFQEPMGEAQIQFLTSICSND